MELRDVLVILGIVLIALILWDGIRRMGLRKPKPRRPVTDLGPDPEEEKKKAELARELPNGGARVRDMTEQEREFLSSKLNLRERVPMLMDSVDSEPEFESDEPEPVTQNAEQQPLDFEREQDSQQHSHQPERAHAAPPKADANRPISARDDAESWDEDWHFSAVDDEDAKSVRAPDTVAKNQDSQPEAPDDSVVQAGDSGPSQSDVTEADSQPLQETPDHRKGDQAGSRETDGADSGYEPESEPESDPATASAAMSEVNGEYMEDTRPVEELVIMHVMAREKGEIAGGDLLELLLRAGLRFGPLDIFHYRNPMGQMEFSLANCVQPGTLNPDSMDQTTMPGVTLFMQLPLRADLMTSFDHMYEMAAYLSKNLEADLLDEEHSTVTPQRVEHYRERLRNFARAQLIQAHE